MRLTKMLGRRVTAERVDAAVAQLACWAASILILILDVAKLASLSGTEVACWP